MRSLYTVKIKRFDFVASSDYMEIQLKPHYF